MFSYEDLQIILTSLPDPAFIITRSGLYVAVYGGRDSRYYHDGSPLVGLNVRDFMGGILAEWLLEQVDHALSIDRLHIVEYPLSEQDVSKLNGIGPSDSLWFEARIRALPFKVEGEDAVLWVASNITQRHRLETDLRLLAQTDPLTGLWNRRYFGTLAHEEFKATQSGECSVSLLMIDIDHFKMVNDSFGHPVGDRILVDLAAIFAIHLKDGDRAARWGGEEFLILLTNANVDQAVRIAERIRGNVEEHVFTKGVRTTVSIGVSCASSADAAQLDDLVAEADDALYDAKEAGRNCVRLAQGRGNGRRGADLPDAVPSENASIRKRKVTA